MSVAAGSAGHPTLGVEGRHIRIRILYEALVVSYVCQDRIRGTYTDAKETDGGHELGSRKAYNPVSELRLYV
jgi:hypothetical protein